MSDTPRTDAVDKILQGRPVLDVIPTVLNFARKLEEELNAAYKNLPTIEEYQKRCDDAMRLSGEALQLERDKQELLERLAERTKDYTTHAAKQLDKLREANKNIDIFVKALEELAKDDEVLEIDDTTCSSGIHMYAEQKGPILESFRDKTLNIARSTLSNYKNKTI